MVSEGEIPFLDSGEYLKISFEDHGTGMTEEVRQAAFDPFFTTKPVGEGLGLSITHSIARRHAGTVEIASTPGAGTTVMLYLPTGHIAN